MERQQDFHQSPFTYAQQVTKNRGRLEICQCWADSDREYLAYLHEGDQWAGLETLAMIVTQRHQGDKIETHTRYFISSLAVLPKTLLKIKRSHWRIENQLHWTLEVAFREDASHLRKDHAPQNFAILRHMAVNLLKQQKSTKRSIHVKKHLAG